MTDDQQQRLDILILARLATAGSRPLTARKLEADLFRFVEARLSQREWTTQCSERLRALQMGGEVDERRTPTTTGLERLRRVLGVEELPGKWAAVWQALVPALALDLPGAKWAELASAGKLRARLIRQHRGLSLPPTPTLTQAVDAQAWQELRVDERGSLGAASVKLALVQQALGIPVRSLAEAVNAWCWTILGQPPQLDFPMGKLRRVLLERTLGTSMRAPTLDATKVGELLATQAAGTTKTDIEGIRRSLVSRWIFGGPAATTAASAQVEARSGLAPVEPAATAVTGPLPLDEWAQAVQALADAAEDGRYGDDRVFIVSVWHVARAIPGLGEASLAAFKAQLVEANRAGLLRLHRADLANLMDRTLVDESETHYLTATFHFVQTAPRRPS